MSSLTEIENILSSGEHESIIGKAENEKLEFKQEPYRLDINSQKIELVKDVSSFANHEGGLIIIGVKTQTKETHIGDEAVKFRYVDNTLFNTQQYLDIIRDWIYPHITGIELIPFPSKQDATKSLFVIKIPLQTNENKPYLIKPIINENEKRSEIIFGIFKRQFDRSQHTKIEQIHSIIKDGQKNNQILDKLDSIEIQLQNKSTNNNNISADLSEKTSKTPIKILSEEISSNKSLDTQINTALKIVNLDSKPSFALGVKPVYPLNLGELFSSADHPLVKLLNTPPYFREEGFNIDSGDNSKIIQGKLRRASIDEDRLLELWKNGSLIFCSTAGTSFLTWSGQDPNSNTYIVNPLALSESIYLFLLLTNKILYTANSDTMDVHITFMLSNLIHGNISLGMCPGNLKSFAWRFKENIHRAPKNSFKEIITGSVSEDELPKLAFNIVSSLYEWFGLEHDKIPYTSKINNYSIIDKNKIIEAGSG